RTPEPAGFAPSTALHTRNHVACDEQLAEGGEQGFLWGWSQT
ncbi:MAG: hypothetical protein ACI8UD_003577, partial [Planctomycetota bacterium]